MPLNENWKTWPDFPKSFEEFKYIKDQTVALSLRTRRQTRLVIFLATRINLRLLRVKQWLILQPLILH